MAIDKRESFMSFKELNKYMDEMQKRTVTCKCGHRVTFNSKRNKVLCNWCGEMVYKNEKEKFKDILEKRLNSGRKN